MIGFRNLRQIVMVATTGRSGSLFLANLINSNAKNASAEHEPRVVAADLSASWYQEENATQLSNLVRRKLTRLKNGDRLSSLPMGQALLRTLGRKKGICRKLNLPTVPIREIYVEVNNSFLKAFGESLLEAVPTIRVIHLTRNPLQMAKSAANRGSHPDPKRPYYLWPSAPRNAIRLSESACARLTPFQLALWYWIEMESRFAAITESFASLQWQHVQLESLNDCNQVSKLFESLGIEHNELSTSVDTHRGSVATEIGESDLRDAVELVSLLPSDCLSRLHSTYGLEKLLQNFESGLADESGAVAR